MTSKQDGNRNDDGTFAEGKSGNPGGRPKKEWTWAGLFREVVENESLEYLGKDKGLLKQAIAEKIITKAAAGDLRAIEIIIDRMDGKPKQSVEVSKRDPDKVVVIG